MVISVCSRQGVRRIGPIFLSAVVLAVGLSACGASPASPETAPPLSTPVSAEAHAGAGEIVYSEKANAGSLGQTELAIYRSTDGASGRATEVSAAFFLPQGSPPPGGWPVIAVGHGTTGVAPDCGPTVHPATLGSTAPVADLLRRGFAVTLIDYQGLGVAAIRHGDTAEHPAHPYLEPRSAAYNLADSVRALRHLHPGQLSNRWAAAGHSQGGQAAWAASELDTSYAPELRLVAAMAMAPAANLIAISGIGSGDTIPHDRAWIMPELVTGLSVSNPALNRWDFLRGQVRSQLSLLISCDPANASRRESALNSVTSADVAPSSSTAMNTLRTTIESYTLPQRVSRVPLYVMQGTKDPVVPESSTAGAVLGACSMKSPVSYHTLDGRDHDIGDDMSGYEWLDHVMRGAPTTSTC